MEKDNLFSTIPHVDKLLNKEIIKECNVYRHEVVEAVRDILSDIRETLRTGKSDKVPKEDEIAREAVDLAMRRSLKSIRKVINGTGVILHSNLGRACYSTAAAKAAFNAAVAYSSFEYDIKKGERGNRTAVVEKYLVKITDAEAALVVNNNAAAVLLTLTTIAKGGNVLVSRGELVEIGGGFRVPEIITACGASLRAVGTTNKTRLRDYEKAISKNTKALLKVHASNFKIVGFSESATIKELAALSKSRNIPLVEDIGSGALIDMRKYGINGEPFAKQSLKDSTDIVSFSGDKLLGGPQCGIILGKAKYIEAMRKHPLYRALRLDKTAIAALSATLRVYADSKVAEQEIPALSMISITEDELKKRANKLRDAITKLGGYVEIIETQSVAGGGSVPGLTLPSYAIAPQSTKSAGKIEQQLRELPIPIVGRIEEDRLLIDVRTLFETDFEYIASNVAEISSA